MSGTVLQQHIRGKTIAPEIIQDALKLEKSTLRKWGTGDLYPNRINAANLINLFAQHGHRIDYNDIYLLMDKAS